MREIKVRVENESDNLASLRYCAVALFWDAVCEAKAEEGILSYKAITALQTDSSRS